jgi:limonene-1,2-epoxide hydrolase
MQPLHPTVHGQEHASAYWRRIFTLMPDLHIDVVNWAASADNVVYIEFRINGTLGSKPVSWPAIDRYELDGAGRVR